MKNIITLSALFFSLNTFASSANFQQVTKIIRQNLGNGYKGIVMPSDQRDCVVTVKYETNTTWVSIKSIPPNGSQITELNFVVQQKNDELTISDQSSSSSSSLIYLSVGNMVETSPKKIDRRMLTLRDNSIDLEYKSKNNPLKHTAGKGCYRK